MKFSEKIPTFTRFGRLLSKGARKLARPFFFSTVCVVTLVALIIAEETYRTAKAWENYQAAAKARGEKLTLAEFSPPAVPDDQNFAMTPLLKPFFSDPSYGDQLQKRLSLDISEESDLYTTLLPEEFSQWERGEQMDLRKWVAFFQRPDVLAELKKHEADMAEISAALLRPYSRFPFHYDNLTTLGMGFSLHGRSLMSLSRLFQLRCFAELVEGKNDEALADTLTLLRLSQANRDEPLIVSQVYSDFNLEMGLQIAWEGLATHRWTDAQLATLQQEIQKIDLFPQFLRAEQSERAYFCDWLVSFSQQTWSDRMSMFKDSWDNAGIHLQAVILLSLSRVGISRALVVGNTWYELVFRIINVADRRFDLEQMKASMLESKQGNTAYGYLIQGNPLLDNPSLYNVDRDMVKFAYTQSSLDEAAVACALERYRLAEGSYPEKLEELSPQFIAKLPHDDVSGEPLHYHRTPNGQFMLYSVGWVGKDLGGAVDPKSQQGYIDGGNWVWQYPAP